MAAITRIATKALDSLGGPKIILAAIPGGIGTLAREGGVSPGRVSQILRQNPLRSEWEVYEQLGQRPPVSPFGPLFDQSEPSSSPPEAA